MLDEHRERHARLQHVRVMGYEQGQAVLEHLLEESTTFRELSRSDMDLGEVEASGFEDVVGTMTFVLEDRLQGCLDSFESSDELATA